MDYLNICQVCCFCKKGSHVFKVVNFIRQLRHIRNSFRNLLWLSISKCKFVFPLK